MTETGEKRKNMPGRMTSRWRGLFLSPGNFLIRFMQTHPSFLRLEMISSPKGAAERAPHTFQANYGKKNKARVEPEQ